MGVKVRLWLGVWGLEYWPHNHHLQAVVPLWHRSPSAPGGRGQCQGERWGVVRVWVRRAHRVATKGRVCDGGRNDCFPAEAQGGSLQGEEGGEKGEEGVEASTFLLTERVGDAAMAAGRSACRAALPRGHSCTNPEAAVPTCSVVGKQARFHLQRRHHVCGHASNGKIVAGHAVQDRDVRQLDAAARKGTKGSGLVGESARPCLAMATAQAAA